MQVPSSEISEAGGALLAAASVKKSLIREYTYVALKELS